MKEYHKIPTVWERDPETKYKTLKDGCWATPELAMLKGITWRFTEKVDGTNIRIQWDGVEVKIRGRSDNAQIPPFLLDKLEETFHPELLESQFGANHACLYGEGYGAKIQKGGGLYIPDGVDFILFDVWVEGYWLEWEDVCNVAEGLEIKIVPTVSFGPLPMAVDMVMDGPFTISLLAAREPEGLVMRPLHDLFDRNGKRIIAKIKLKDFPND